MDDLISRQAVLDYIDSMPCEVTKDGRYMVRRIRLTEYIADTLPSAERKKGRWIDCNWSVRCSECDYAIPMAVWNFCPNCGAEMRGKKEK